METAGTDKFFCLGQKWAKNLEFLVYFVLLWDINSWKKLCSEKRVCSGTLFPSALRKTSESKEPGGIITAEPWGIFHVPDYHNQSEDNGTVKCSGPFQGNLKPDTENCSIADFSCIMTRSSERKDVLSGAGKGCSRLRSPGILPENVRFCPFFTEAGRISGKNCP